MKRDKNTSMGVDFDKNTSMGGADEAGAVQENMLVRETFDDREESAEGPQQVTMDA